jgi:hypothetical protein
MQGLSEMGINSLIPVPNDVVPLFVPIYLENRNDVRKRMSQQEIYCPIHWPLENMPVKKGKEMAEHELSLIVDQRYGEKEMKHILDCIQG